MATLQIDSKLEHRVKGLKIQHTGYKFQQLRNNSAACEIFFDFCEAFHRFCEAFFKKL